jgi:coenzyme F420-reducing hydrogenase delta subunit
MKLPHKNSRTEQFLNECEYALDNCIQVSKSLQTGLDKVLSCVCYITDKSFICTVQQYLNLDGVLVVVVDRLPVNAMVEFHFVMFSEKGLTNIKLVKDEEDPNLFVNSDKKLVKRSVFLKGVVESVEYGFTNLVVVKGFCEGVVDLEFICKLAKNMVDEVVVAAGKFKVLMLKCFYIQVIPFETIYGILEKILEDMRLDCACICIPVGAMDERVSLSMQAMCSLHSSVIQ